MTPNIACTTLRPFIVQERVMNGGTTKGVVYINIYVDIATGTVTVSRRYHESSHDAKRASRGTCASGRRRLLARIRVPWREGQHDD